jgi:hypothetical protein
VKEFLEFANSWKFKIYLFFKIPIAFLSGVRIVHINDKKAVVSLPYKWLSQNPFHSIYFACQAMAGEMSTGLLIMNAIHQSNASIAMLVVELKMNFYKKADVKIHFECDQGDMVLDKVNEAITTGLPVMIDLKAVSKNNKGEEISSIEVKWSIKKRN